MQGRNFGKAGGEIGNQNIHDEGPAGWQVLFCGYAAVMQERSEDGFLELSGFALSDMRILAALLRFIGDSKELSHERKKEKEPAAPSPIDVVFDYDRNGGITSGLRIP